jgi:hypothetical protein
MSSENVPDDNVSAKDAPSERDRWIDAVARLIELTQNGEMEWRPGVRQTPGRGEPTTPPYFADYKNHRYKLEETWVKAPRRGFSEEVLDSMNPFASPPKDRHVVSLDLVDERGLSLYSVPTVSPLWDLLRIVQKQTAADDALQELLG